MNMLDDKLKSSHADYNRRAVARGASLTGYYCPFCFKRVEIVQPAPEQVGSDGKWSSMRTCTHCQQMSMVLVWPNGHSEAGYPPMKQKPKNPTFLKQNTVTGRHAKKAIKYFWLHADGSLVTQLGNYAYTQYFEDSELVKMWWVVDLTDRLDTYNILFTAWVAGAKEAQIRNLATEFKCLDDNDCQIYCDNSALDYGRDGDQWMVYGKDFVSIQESTVAFGVTLFDAVYAYYKGTGIAPQTVEI